MNRIIKQKATKRIVLGKTLIEQAGLRDEIELIVQEGAIHILSAVKPKGWKILESLGDDAVEGVLDNPSENHNNYLYGAKS